MRNNVDPCHKQKFPLILSLKLWLIHKINISPVLELYLLVYLNLLMFYLQYIKHSMYLGTLSLLLAYKYH